MRAPTLRLHLQHFRLHLGAAALLAGAACAPAAAPAPPPPPPPTLAPTPTPIPAAVAPTSAPVAPTPTPPVAISFDQQFVDMMVPHHQGALEMARIAQQRATRPEIKQMAEDILRGQQEEITRMKAWRKAWFGSDETPPLTRMPMVEGMEMPASMGHAGMAGPSMTMNMQKDIDALRTVEPFDLAFVDAMIAHHQDAINASRAALQRAQRPEIKDLALAIIEAQQKEIGLMRGWRLGLSTAVAPAPAAKPAVKATADLAISWASERHEHDEDEIARRVKGIPGVVTVSATSSGATITYDPQQTNPSQLRQAIQGMGYLMQPASP